MKDAILELKSLIRGNRMGRNSAENPKIPGPLPDRITKTQIYDKQRKSATDLGIAKIKNVISDFAKQVRRKSTECQSI